MMNEAVDNNGAIRRSKASWNNSSERLTLPEPVNSDGRKFSENGDDDDEDNAGEDDRVDPHFFLSEGNKDFLKKRFICAIKAYSQGLKRIEVKMKEKKWEEGNHGVAAENQPIKPDNKKENNNNYEEKKELRKALSVGISFSSVDVDLFCNRALAYISIGNYAAAVEDTEQVLSVSPTHFKAILRKAKALAGLEKYEDAINCVNSFLIEGLSNSGKCSQSSGEKLLKEQEKEILLYLEKLKWKKHQSETGDFYEAPLIMDKPFEPAPSDWVDHIGPVRIETFPGKGRGLVAAEDLPPSKLILACRAFEIIFLDGKSNPEDNVSEQSKKALHKDGLKIEDDPTLNLLSRRVYDRLTRNPEKRVDFYRLYAGNELGCLEPTTKSSSEPPPPLDMERIYGICRTNTFANSGDSYPEVEKSVGIWLFPAFVNHQCIGGNCTWKIFGDFIFVRTYKAVKKGEELIHSYVSPAYPFKARYEVLTKRLGFVCTCVLCELDRKLAPSVHEEKAKLKQLALNQQVKFAQLEISEENSADYSKKVEASILLLEQIIAKLEKIQPDHGIYNASLHDPLQKLGLKYFGIGHFQKTIKVMERACSLMKACMLPHAIADCSLWIIASNLQMGNEKQAKKWGKILKENLLLAFGDVQVLQTLGPWAIDPMTKWGLLGDQALHNLI